MDIDEDTIDLTDIDEDMADLINQSSTVDGIEPPRKEHLDVLQKVFGHKEFRPLQWQIIHSIINNRRDNCAIMATGYGKSLCFQYPSMYCGGITIVISPLISLMEDQILALTVANINACLLGSAQSKQKKVIEDIFQDKYSFVYLTPEFCCGDFGRKLLSDMVDNLSITLIAIDEAHCISSWGHDFRHQYRQLSMIRSLVPNVPVLAVTATATKRVTDDIVKSLKLRNPQILYSGFDRPNLYFSIELKGSGGIMQDLHKAMIRKDGKFTFAGPTIIYCITRKQTTQLAATLQCAGVNCLPYHAGMSIKERKEVHEKFVRDQIPAIVATIAFGMGIDKPDIRNVIHYGASRDMESYYQEVGRAGRDGQPSNCIMFYNSGDFETLRALREMDHTSDKNREHKEEKARFFRTFMENSGCRRQYILQYFEGKEQSSLPKSNCCDNCTKKLQTNQVEYEELNDNGLLDITQYFHTYLASMAAIGPNRGVNTYILFITGSKSFKLHANLRKNSLYGSGNHKTTDWWKAIAGVLERDKYIQKSTYRQPKYSYCVIEMTTKGKEFLEKVVKNSKDTKVLIEPPPILRALLKKKKKFGIPSYTPLGNPRTPTRVINPDEWKLKKKTLQHATNDTNSPTIILDEVKKEEKMKLYRMLLAKRTDLAYSLDCMPYMIASNETLMKLSELKPISIDELRECKLEGFTDVKIEKFGQEFLKVISSICPGGNAGSSKSIREILLENPLPRVTFSLTIETSYNMYNSGMSIENIAKQRSLTYGSICSHLLTCMKLGFPIKLKEFTVTQRIKKNIMNVVNVLSENNELDTKSLTQIKNLCPPDVTFDQIKAVLTYIEIRKHLNQLNCDYIEFDEDGNDEEAEEKETQQLSNPKSSKLIEDDFGNTSNEEDAALHALLEEIETGGYLDDNCEKIEDNDNLTERQGEINNTENKEQNQEIESQNSPPSKRQKVSLSLLHTPSTSRTLNNKAIDGKGAVKEDIGQTKNTEVPVLKNQGYAMSLLDSP